MTQLNAVYSKEICTFREILDIQSYQVDYQVI